MEVNKIVSGLIGAIIGIIVIFSILSATASNLVNAGNNVSASGLPLASLFSGTGIVLLVFMAGILITLVAVFLKVKKGR